MTERSSIFSVEGVRQVDGQASDRLLGLVAQGDRDAFSQLYDDIAPRLYAVAIRVLGPGPDADEVLQETFVKAWCNADKWPGVSGTASSWLLAIARHTAIDRRRAASRRDRHMKGVVRSRGVLPIVTPSATATPEDEVTFASEAQQLGHCLDTLPRERADVIRKAYFSGDSYAEIAKETGHPEGTLKSWVRRSLTALRQCLEERGVGGVS